MHFQSYSGPRLDNPDLKRSLAGFGQQPPPTPAPSLRRWPGRRPPDTRRLAPLTYDASADSRKLTDPPNPSTPTRHRNRLRHPPPPMPSQTANHFHTSIEPTLQNSARPRTRRQIIRRPTRAHMAILSLPLPQIKKTRRDTHPLSPQSQIPSKITKLPVFCSNAYTKL